MSARLSVCLSVHLSRGEVLSKRQNLSSHKQRQTITQGIKICDAKDLDEIPTSSPPKERQMDIR